MTNAGLSDHVPAPRAKRPFVVLAFASTRDSLAAEHALREAGLNVGVMPLPRHRGKLCGVSLRLAPTDEPAALQALSARGVEVASRDEIMDL